MITISLCRISRIWLIKQVLNPNKNLLDSNSWSPTLTGEIWKSKTMKSTMASHRPKKLYAKLTLSSLRIERQTVPEG